MFFNKSHVNAPSQLEVLTEVAGAYKGKLLAVYVDVGLLEAEDIFNYFGEELPAVLCTLWSL